VRNPGARGYFAYFGAAANHPTEPACTVNYKGYYSYDIGSWHMVALNSECTQPGVGGCGATSPPVQWLKADLAAHPSSCTLAYFHRPYFSDKGGTVAKVKQLFKALYDGGADVLLVGHQHIYERFAPMTPTGARNVTTGIRQFIIGTGGTSQTALAATPPANSEARNTGTFGVLKLTLHPTSYDFQFVPEAGKTLTDSGNQACH
jgi:acid phosphatase type 7